MNLEWRPYRRPFLVPLQTAHGVWFERLGIALRVTDPDGRRGYGEVAPIPSFRSETVEEAGRFLQGLDGSISQDRLERIPEMLPATRFGLGSAIDHLGTLERDPGPPYQFLNTALLSGGEVACEQLETAVGNGFRSAKYKLGSLDLEMEIRLIRELLDRLPADGRLRLDANGSLQPDALRPLLRALDRDERLEFLEQPLPPGQEPEMEQVGRGHRTPLALDESVVHPDELAFWAQGGRWSGRFIVKPSISGSPQELWPLLVDLKERVVVSSSFETGIGTQACLRLASRAGIRAPVGFGTLAYFDDDLGLLAHSGTLREPTDMDARLEALWTDLTQHFARW